MIKLKSQTQSLDRIVDGLRLAYERMLVEKQQNDESIVFSLDGEIVKMKARKLIAAAPNQSRIAI